MSRLRMNRSNGCWVELFDGQGLRGNNRRLTGPADFLGLRIAEKGWGDEIRSIVVGPCAYVACFDSSAFQDSVFWLLPNQTVHRVEELGCGDRIDSIRLFDRPPFAHEPGYAPYMLWAASHIAALNHSPPGEDEEMLRGK